MLPPTLLLGMVLAASCRNTQYNVVELPFTPSVISSSGVVAGTTELNRAVVWRRRSGLRELQVPEGFRFTEPVAITKSGAVVVNALDVQARRLGTFVYSKKAVVALPGNQTKAHGITPSGVILGEGVPPGKTTSVAVYWSNNSPHPVDLWSGGVFKAGNEMGVMVGDAYDSQGRYHAFAWSPGHDQRMMGPPDRYSSAVAIDAAGHVLLQVGKEAYLDQAGTLQHLDLASQFYNSVRSMNNCDVVVGGYGPDSDHYRAFIWSAAAGFRDLDTLIPAGSGWSLNSAAAINDRGEIVGSGAFHDDERGFLLVPRR